MEYVAIIEKAPDGSHSAYVPDLPGCVSCGDSPAEARALIEQAVSLHLEKNENWFFAKFPERIERKQWMIVLDIDDEISYRVIDLDLDQAQAYLRKGYGVISLLSDQLYDNLLRRLNKYSQETRFSAGSFS